jgi:hypothetical protein
VGIAVAIAGEPNAPVNFNRSCEEIGADEDLFATLAR